ncbi:TonB-dependent receptor [Seonamhaeicola sp.]|uniref:TonB-dependent receptor n=1 Tax=Seonamhaeicola sp. TaxID=1912245 RepID=UPI00261D28C7|nr:Plug domain-containing protein [Seonamhaeicola sp.]
MDENIWFTSYLVDGITHEKSTKSWVIHVELIDEKDSIVSKKKLFTNNISAAGDFRIGKDWKSGKYLLRAYTNYMRNYSSDYFFKKEINILSLEKKDSIEGIPQAKNKDIKTIDDFKQIKPDLHFYPEGGDLVKGIRSRVAIKVKNIGTNDINLSGEIYNSNNEVVSEFKTTTFGLGIFTLKPEPNQAYHAKLIFNGVEYEYPIPNAIPDGHTLEVANSEGELLVDVRSNRHNGLYNTYLVLHQRGKLVFSKFQHRVEANYTLKIPTNDLKDGVAHLTLFDASGNPTCERLVFVSNDNNKGTIEINESKKSLGNRQKQTLNILTKAHNGDVLPSRLSMSIRDLNAFPYSKYHKNIKTYLLLNSDLRGAIENPGYFFNGKDELKKLHLLDLTMLTNGWRRFTWKDILYNKEWHQFEPEKGIYISGKIRKLQSPYNPVPAASTRLTFYNENIAQEPIKKTDAMGNFEYGPFIFFDSVQTIVESRTSHFKSKDDIHRNLHITISHNDNSPEISRTNIFKDNQNEGIQLENFLKINKYIRKLNFEINKKRERLEEVMVIAQLESEAEKRTEELNNRTNHGITTHRLDFEVDFFDSGQNLIEAIGSGAIPGVNAYESPNGTTVVSIRGNSVPPLVLLDQIPINIGILSKMHTTEVSFIDILKGADATFYPRSSGGVIAIYTKTGERTTNELLRMAKRKPGIIDFAAQGFYTAKEFYAPDHINGFDEFAEEDVRTTLHWEPKIVVNSDFGKDISFFTSDTDSDYLIEIQGVSESGIPLHAITTFSVE